MALRISREAIDELLEGQHPPRDPYDRTVTDLIMRVHRLEGELHAVQAVTTYLVGQMGGEVTVPDMALTGGNPWQISVTRNNANDGLVLHVGDWADAMHVPAPAYLRD